MTFLLLCGALLLLSTVFYLRKPRIDAQEASLDSASANIEWYRQRREELQEDVDGGLLEDARLRLLEDDATPSTAASAPARDGFPGWMLLPLLVAFSAGLYYWLGAAPDVAISQRLATVTATDSPVEMAQLIGDIETRAAQRPDNLHYAALLGRYYMAQEDYARAAAAYDGIASEVPEDAQALAYAAQAAYLASGRQLSDAARLRAEQALAADPHQRTALGLLGMASYEQGKYRAAVEYWERLLAVEPPGSQSASMIAGVIETARQRMGGTAATGTASNHAASSKIGAGAGGPADSVAPSAVAAGAAKATAPGVSISVVAPEGAVIEPGAIVFVLARDALSGSRMPIAVQRFNAAQLPLALRLDDGNSMAGQKLSSFKSVIVAVQVSPGGQPGEANASWLGQAGPLTPSADGQPVQIVLQPAS